jgi:predicted transcriptional regulator
MQIIDIEHPAFINALAIKAGLKQSAVSRTSTKLANQGFVRFINEPGHVKVPKLVARHITISLDIHRSIDEI